MTQKTYTFANCRFDSGVVFLGIQGSKQGWSFDREHLLSLVKAEVLRDREHQALMAIAAYIAANGVNAPPSGLNGTTFTADDGDG